MSCWSEACPWFGTRDDSPRVGTIGGEPVYKLGWHDYVLLYRISSHSVEIARIVHGKRDWAGMLDETE